MCKFEHKCYKDKQNNKILSMTVYGVPFMIGFSESQNIIPYETICDNILYTIRSHFKIDDPLCDAWVNLPSAVGCAVDDLCSLQ